MARARGIKTKSKPATSEARDLALTIRQGERAGLTQREIGAILGIDPRTVRKIKSGQTSGRKTRARLLSTPRAARATPNAFNAEFVIGYDADGNPVIGSANIIVADVTTRTGARRAPTPLDVFRIQGLASVAAAERAAMARRYAGQLRARVDPDATCERKMCGHPDKLHSGSARGDLFPCDACACPDFLNVPETVRLRAIGTMRKPAAAILRTGGPA